MTLRPRVGTRASGAPRPFDRERLAMATAMSKVAMVGIDSDTSH